MFSCHVSSVLWLSDSVFWGLWEWVLVLQVGSSGFLGLGFRVRNAYGHLCQRTILHNAHEQFCTMPIAHEQFCAMPTRGLGFRV